VTTPPADPGPPPSPYGPPPGSYAPPPGAPNEQSSPYGYAVAPPADQRPRRTWDLVLTIVLLVLDVVLAAIMSFFGLFLAMASDSCGVRDCNTELIATGMMVAVGLPWLVLIVTVIAAVVVLVMRRLAFWIPLVGGALIVASLVLGFVVAGAGVPTS
jgi:hypothetical protein